ncbi:glycerol kinase GlpK [Roseomonas sp. 18066]|uniref:glycerol kinase GlpK n=1 Tax=Roseomonas sp. 18066 TaxID=2681412 RepID=UPI00135C672D|nr:glycerol kinase GlpK [Roseomonas sp. 18066]
MTEGLILALDQGTTSTRSILFSTPGLAPLAMAQQEIAQHYPGPGWVEHDPEDLFRSSLATMRQAIDKAGVEVEDIAGIGIANQRETVLVWDRATGRPLHRAIVWQDRRTAAACAVLRQAGHAAAVEATTGLLIDPYFSGTKIAWILDNVSGARRAAEQGRLAFGTVDTWLIWRLTGGRAHVTDATNAARTLLYDIQAGAWDPAMLALFRIPEQMLPEVLDCAADFGTAEPALLGAAIPIRGVAGDQQAATIGQACFQPGMVKATYGTGAFALLNTGDTPVRSQNRLLTTIAYQLDGRRTHALEGAIFVAGAAVQWLRDGLGLIASAAESSRLAASADPARRIYLVPAFVGLGVPHWDAEARGAIFGLTRDSGPADFARAALEATAFQTRDLLQAMHRDLSPGQAIEVLRADGGMAASDWTMQCLADVLDRPVDRPAVQETTALGAAYLAGLRSGLCPPPEDFARQWRLQRRFTPALDPATREAAYAGWCDAVRRTLSRPA